MSKNTLKIDVPQWVRATRNDPVAYLQRQATEILLNAIASNALTGERLFLKGGVLMGLAYGSPRQTSDVDLTAGLPPTLEFEKTLTDSPNAEFPHVAAALGYVDLMLRVQSVSRRPRKDNFECADFPALKIKVAYAKRGTNQERALQKGQSSDVIEIDISFNEPLTASQILELTGGAELRAYSLIDLVAEKYRAMIQQVIRNRNRRQDVYDLNALTTEQEIDERLKQKILESFIEKCTSRNITVHRDSLNDPEIETRSRADWDTLKLELNEVPDFAKCFEQVKNFYKSLPWAKV